MGKQHYTITLNADTVEKAKGRGLAISTILNNLLEIHLEKEDKGIPDEIKEQLPSFDNLMRDKIARDIYFNDENSEVNKAFRLTLTYPQLLLLERMKELPVGITDRRIPRYVGDE